MGQGGASVWHNMGSLVSQGDCLSKLRLDKIGCGIREYGGGYHFHRSITSWSEEKILAWSAQIDTFQTNSMVASVQLFTDA